MTQRLAYRVAFALALAMLVTGMSARMVQADTPIRLVFASELAPLSFEEAGKVRGILVDLASEVFVTRLGGKLDAALYPWERAQHMVEVGEADGFITIATSARAAYANCGRIPVLRAPLHPLVRRDHPRRSDIAAAGSLADLRAFAIVSYLGNGWAKQNLAKFDVYYAADYQASLNGLAQGRGDVGFATTTTGGYFLREFALGNKLEMLPLVVDTFDYVLCLGKKSPHAARLAEFERVLEVLRSDGGYSPIMERYGLQADALY